MKVLTIIATIFMPLTFIAGVYGMNFEYMPELRWRWGYPIILLVMAVIGISMIRIFRKNDGFDHVGLTTALHEGGLMLDRLSYEENKRSLR